MMIALVSDEYPAGIGGGGIGTYSKALAGLLANCREHEVHVFCQSDAIERRSAGELIHQVEGWNPRWRLARYIYHRLMSLLGPVAYRVRWGISVGNAVLMTEKRLGRKFDVIEVPEAGGYGALLRLAGVNNAMLIRLHAGTAILRRHSRQRISLNDKLIALLERWSVEKGDLVTSPSRALVRESRHDLGINEGDCLIYPNVLPSSTVCSENTRKAETDQRSVLVVGRLGYLKGTDLVLQAMGRLQAAGYPDLHLVLIGRSEWPRDQLESKVARNLRPGTCDLLGEVDRSAVIGAMQRARMMVQASHFENYPMTILEALQSGCLVIGSNAGGIPEIITHQRTGLLFESGSVESLESQIRWALEHPEDSAGIASAGSEWAKSELSSNKVLSSVIHAYEKSKEHSDRRK